MYILDFANIASRVLLRLYIVFSCWSAFQVYWRRGRYIHLEFAPKRIRGTNWEPRRLAFLRKFRLVAVISLIVRAGCLGWFVVEALAN
ncbi:MAG: hypothetical protein ACRYG5_04980 [Janthinobacterium lividum]